MYIIVEDGAKHRHILLVDKWSIFLEVTYTTAIIAKSTLHGL